MGLMNQKIDQIMGFLYGDKKAELIAEISFVKYAFENYSSIMLHDSQQVATISSLQESRKIAIKDIEFYMYDLTSKATAKAKTIKIFRAWLRTLFRFGAVLNYLCSFTSQAALWNPTMPKIVTTIIWNLSEQI